jgi:hypothetical protein
MKNNFLPGQIYCFITNDPDSFASIMLVLHDSQIFHGGVVAYDIVRYWHTGVTKSIIETNKQVWKRIV